MKILLLAGGVLLASALTVRSLSAAPAATKSNDALIARGKYLVTTIGACADCHTPRDQKGQLIQAQWLQGAPLTFKPTVPIPDWKMVAPRIAGLPGWTTEQGITFFTTGKMPDGSYAGSPMPAYRVSKADAAAIVTYLKSLK